MNLTNLKICNDSKNNYYSPINSYYYSPNQNEENLINYKDWVGGSSLWELQGNLQKNFLISQGLSPEHKFLDLGCGCLRAGIKLIEYLYKDNYYGQDINLYLLRMGLENEMPNNLKDKVNINNFCISKDFTLLFDQDIKFDMAISQSVFTHLPLNHLYYCLLKIKDYFKKDSKFFVSYWIIPEDYNLCDFFDWGHGIITSHISDVYHYKKSQIENIFKDPLINKFWSLEYIGDWNHPRDQKMFCFIKN